MGQETLGPNIDPPMGRPPEPFQPPSDCQIRDPSIRKVAQTHATDPE